MPAKPKIDVSAALPHSNSKCILTYRKALDF